MLGAVLIELSVHDETVVFVRPWVGSYLKLCLLLQLLLLHLLSLFQLHGRLQIQA